MNKYGRLNNGQLEIVTSIEHETSRTIGITAKIAQQFNLKEIVDVLPIFHNYETSYTETDTQIIVNYIEVVAPEMAWHEQTNFQIKFTADDLLDLLEEVPAMIEYTKTLTTYRDMMFRYFYVNYFNDMERELLEYYGGIVTERSII